MIKIGPFVIAKRDRNRWFMAEALPADAVTYRKVRRLRGDWWLYRRAA